MHHAMHIFIFFMTERKIISEPLYLFRETQFSSMNLSARSIRIHHKKYKIYTHCDASVWAHSCSLAATNEMSFLRTLFSFPPGTGMFYFPGCALCIICRVTAKAVGFPHSEISGSKVARYLPGTYRHHATSFIAS